MELKKERHWLIFKRQIPENEWEAKYLAQQDKTYTWATAVIFGLIVLIVSIAILAINIHPCEAEFEGSVSGVFDINTSNFPPEAFEEFKITNTEGKIRVSGSCSAVALFSVRGSRY